MDLMSGLDKFGLNPDELNSLYEDNKRKTIRRTEVVKRIHEEEERDFLFRKAVICPVCDRSFQTLTVKSSKARLVGSDDDFRPVHKSIDTVQYGVTSCAYCGSSALHNNFAHLSGTQIRLLKEQVASRFKPSEEQQQDFYTYEEAIDKFKLAIYSAIVKHASVSEKAYICLKISWLYRGMGEELQKDGYSSSSEEFKNASESEEYYYKQALNGMTQAVATESFPICGMNQDTMDLLLAQMNFKMSCYDVASKLVLRILVSKTASRHIKDKALDLKDAIIKKIRDGI